MRWLGPVVAAVGLAVAAPAPARADGDRALSGELGWATFSAPGKPTNSQTPPAVSPDFGGSLGVIYEHGISTDFSLRGELVGAAFDGGQANPKTQSAHSVAGIGDVGIVFRFDVLRYVPYAFAGVGGVAATGGPLSTTGPVISIGGGLDMLWDRHHSIGLEVRLASFGTDLTVITAGIRVSTRWGPL